jgi:hypothetical protein
MNEMLNPAAEVHRQTLVLLMEDLSNFALMIFVFEAMNPYRQSSWEFPTGM